MKVLYLIDTLEVAGSERSLLAILQRFERAEPTVCHIYQGDALKPDFEAAGIPVVSLSLPGRYAFRRALREVMRLLRIWNPEILHTTLARANIVGRSAGRLTRVPVVSSLVNESYSPIRLEGLSRSMRWKLRAVQFLDRLTSQWAFHFIANSEAVKTSNCRALGIPPHKVSVIHRGRDPKVFAGGNPKYMDSLRSSLSVPSDAYLILNVGRLLASKGQMELIRAMSLVVREFPSCRLLIAGEGPHRSRLTTLARELGLADVVMLLGLRDDIPILLRLADVFAFPSHYEGHPGALVEAMFAERPIVVSDIPVHRETITHQETGLLVPVKDPKAIAQGIMWMLEHRVQARRMGQQARQVAVRRFHIDQIAAQYEQLYESLLTRWKARV